MALWIGGVAAVLVEEYPAGGAMREVTTPLGVSTKLVRRAMRQLGAATRTPAERAGYPARAERWAASYVQGVVTAEVAARSGVSEPTVRQRLRRHGVAVARSARRQRPQRPQRRKRDERMIGEVIDCYATGETLAELGSRPWGLRGPGAAADEGQRCAAEGADRAAQSGARPAPGPVRPRHRERHDGHEPDAVDPGARRCPRDGPRPGQAAARPAGPGSTTTTRPPPGVCEGVGVVRRETLSAAS